MRVRVLEQPVEAVSDLLRPPADRSRRGPRMIRRNADSPLRVWRTSSGGTPSGVRGFPTSTSSGAEETRTPDFLLAKEALYQLSYGPKSSCAAVGDAASCDRIARARDAAWAPAGEAGSSVACRSPNSGSLDRFECRSLARCTRVGVSGLEPETSALSGQCSNQLS